MALRKLKCTTAMLLVIVGTSWFCCVAGAEEVAPRIGWYGTLESGLAAANRTGRPILLVSGAPIATVSLAFGDRASFGMDGSFLSNEQVVAASREYVCIRLATYEDKRETEFLRSVFTGRGGALENTVFAMLGADGTKPLVRSGRGPFFAFKDAADMATQMESVLKQPAHQRIALDHTEVPAMKDVELELNVAACDQLPLVVIVAADTQTRRALNESLLPIAWEEPLVGQFVYAYATDDTALASIAGALAADGILIVEPGPFGMSGQVIERFAASTTVFDLKHGMLSAIKSHKPVPKDYQAHIRIGTDLGLDWETQVPVTDQQSLQAKERYRANRQTAKGTNR